MVRYLFFTISKTELPHYTLFSAFRFSRSRHMKLKQSQLRGKKGIPVSLIFSILQARDTWDMLFPLGRAAGTGSSGNMAIEA